MGRHSLDDADTVEPAQVAAPAPAEAPMTSSGARPEPVAIAAAAQAVLAALVTIGWVQLDDTTIAAIGTALAAVAAVVFTLIARAKVTPVSDPVLTPK